MGSNLAARVIALIRQGEDDETIRALTGANKDTIGRVREAERRLGGIGRQAEARDARP